MHKNYIFLLLFASFLYSESNFQDISISEYKNLLSESKNTKQFYRDYLLNARLSDKEINSYYRQNLESYKQESSHDIDFVVFTVTPSEIDNDENAKNAYGVALKYGK